MAALETAVQCFYCQGNIYDKWGEKHQGMLFIKVVPLFTKDPFRKRECILYVQYLTVFNVNQYNKEHVGLNVFNSVPCSSLLHGHVVEN